VWVAGRFVDGTGLVRGSGGTWHPEGLSVRPPGGIAVTAGRGATQWVANSDLLYRVEDGRAAAVLDVMRQPEDMLVDASGRLWITVSGRAPGRTQGRFYGAMRKAE
jgi:hypothetical protein